ncbi:MAG: ABC transporter ATP-binding protein [Gammaproteobacteria bacterium]|nr:ABC transporter ATP-binding protein [Gammaproteobacteria bacterium]MCP5424094.1 ABC transporter ATP-binding protein [Gammaproteobacteria bacterium]MCP5459489.1 ABC transporter ATP-binding protein [Gammaproteobacteria bacterium]
MTDILLELDHVECRYAERRVVQALSFRIRKGGLVCLLGPSGCGKTTVLRAIAGFMPINAGVIRLRGVLVSAPGSAIPPERRGLGMVFQDYALFPHLNVIDNVTFGLRGRTSSARRQRGMALLDLVGLSEQSRRYPHELSGGQQQRVALARALAPQPDLILLDEPFSSLDVDLRERLAYEVHDILKSQGITGILVTHDQHEAFAMAEQVGVMQDGRLLQWDTPYNLYHEPANRFVADFIGQGRFLDATLLTPDTLGTELGEIHGDRALLWPRGTHLEILLRPDDVIPDPQGNLQAEVVKKAFKGAETLYTLRLGNSIELLSLFPSHLDHHPGERVGVRIDATHMVAFPKSA